MTWVNFLLVALAVCGWAVAAGLYLQAKDALRLAEQWRSIANDAWGDVVRERHVAEFAVRSMERPEFDEEWTPYHDFRKRTDPPPWGLGLEDVERPEVRDA